MHVATRQQKAQIMKEIRDHIYERTLKETKDYVKMLNEVLATYGRAMDDTTAIIGYKDGLLIYHGEYDLNKIKMTGIEYAKIIDPEEISVYGAYKIIDDGDYTDVEAVRDYRIQQLVNQ